MKSKSSVLSVIQKLFIDMERQRPENRDFSALYAENSSVMVQRNRKYRESQYVLHAET